MKLLMNILIQMIIINNLNNKMKELKDYNKKLSDGIIHFMEKIIKMI